jgi:type I restriction enzyme S subunit
MISTPRVQGWQFTMLSSLADKIMVGIASAATHAYRAKGIPMFRNQNIKSGYLDDKDLLFITPEYEAAFQNKRLRTGDLVTMRTGYPGVTAIVPSQYDQSQSFTTLITRPKKGAIDSLFLCHYINSEFGKKFFEQSQIGGAQKNVNASTLRGMPIPVPPRQEQLAIGSAFSDVDALIAGLEKLIAKKRDLKQATMQQLLTGQTRLPGFSGEWTHRSLGSLGVIYGGLVGKSKDDFGHGLASYVPFVNVMANIRIDCGALESVDVESTENQNRVLAGDLLFNGSSETPEEVALCALMTQTVENLYLNSFCFGFRFKEGTQTSGLFLTYLIRSQMGRDLMKALAQGSTRYNLSKSALLQATLVLPSLEEQVAIATILSDMDADLVALEGRLAKTSELKQGMMQELLTGRTRLVSKSEI